MGELRAKVLSQLVYRAQDKLTWTGRSKLSNQLVFRCPKAHLSDRVRYTLLKMVNPELHSSRKLLGVLKKRGGVDLVPYVQWTHFGSGRKRR
jgi:hypothetical protein